MEFITFGMNGDATKVEEPLSASEPLAPDVEKAPDSVPDAQEDNAAEHDTSHVVPELGTTQINPANNLFDDEDDEDAFDSKSESAAHQLFGDDPAEEPEEAPVVKASFDEAYEFAQSEDREFVTLPITVPPIRPHGDPELWMLGLPHVVNIEYEPFDEKECAEQETKIMRSGSNIEKRQLKQMLNIDTIRVRRNSDGSLSSNARFVEFANGSSAIYIGSRVYEADPRNEGTTLLLETSQAPIYHVHGQMKHKRIFKPPTVAALEAKTIQSNSQKRTKLTTVEKSAESELRAKRHLEEMSAPPPKKKKTTLDAAFLESDDF